MASAIPKLHHGWKESAMEAESRKAADFPKIEGELYEHLVKSEMTPILDKVTSLLGSKNPFSKKAKPNEHDVILFDNTAYRRINERTGKLEPWQAEFVAAYYMKGRKDLTATATKIADIIGLDGKPGAHPEVHKTIEERLGPFIQAIAPAKTIEIKIPSPGGSSHNRVLGPSDPNGISSQELLTGGADDADGKTVNCTATDSGFLATKNTMRFIQPEGWTIISDIDDTIKKTMTPDPLGVLKSTFVDEPEVIKGMPELYKTLDKAYTPSWFYLSASPYNLYSFLHEFIATHYHQGTIILRDASWMFFAGFLQSLTEDVQSYKVDRIRKIHSWLPKRKVICIGDSTQSDPESYAEAYKEFPGWIKAIYINKVTDAPHMERKNDSKRFEEAFKDVPKEIWRVFTDPEELKDHARHLAGVEH